MATPDAEKHSAGASEKESEEKEKQSNKMFTQSEYDQAIAKERKAIEDKLKGFDDLKKKADILEKEKKEREQANLTETERQQSRIKELEEENAKLKEEKSNLSKVVLKNDILSDPKFSVMPKAYKALVDGEDEAGMKQAAEKVLSEYHADLEKLKAERPANYGIPPQGGKDESGIPASKNPLTEKIKKRAEEYGLKKS